MFNHLDSVSWGLSPVSTLRAHFYQTAVTRDNVQVFKTYQPCIRQCSWFRLGKMIIAESQIPAVYERLDNIKHNLYQIRHLTLSKSRRQVVVSGSLSSVTELKLLETNPTLLEHAAENCFLKHDVTKDTAWAVAVRIVTWTYQMKLRRVTSEFRQVAKTSAYQ